MLSLSLNPWMYKLTHSPHPLLVFVLLRQSKINLHWLDSSELALQVDTIFVGNDVIWPATLDLPSLISLFFLKKSRMLDCRMFMKYTDSWISVISWGKLEELPQKKLIFGQTYMEFDGWQSQKWWTHNRHVKLSTENEETATESFSPLG